MEKADVLELALILAVSKRPNVLQTNFAIMMELRPPADQIASAV